jgi:alpha-beta hydrolase superfamily lysophospholipase
MPADEPPPDRVETVGFRSGDFHLHGRLRYHVDEAPTVVLLCGLGFHTFEYEPLAAELAARGVNSLSFDFRGHGRSGGPRGRWTLDELVTDTAAAIDFLRQRHGGPIGLFGNSLGAMIAILTGARDERVIGVAAANTPARATEWALTTPQRRVLFALLKLIAPVAPIRISVNPFLKYEQLIDDPAWVSTIRGDPLITHARRLAVPTLRALLETWDGTQAARELHKPLLVIQGRNDYLQPPRQSELVYHAANEPKQYRLVNTGHLPHLENPAAVADLILEFLHGIVGETQPPR